MLIGKLKTITRSGWRFGKVLIRDLLVRPLTGLRGRISRLERLNGQDLRLPRRNLLLLPRSLKSW